MRLTLDKDSAHLLYNALTGRVAYLSKYGGTEPPGGIERAGWYEEKQAANKMREKLWAFLKLTYT